MGRVLRKRFFLFRDVLAITLAGALLTGCTYGQTDVSQVFTQDNMGDIVEDPVSTSSSKIVYFAKARNMFSSMENYPVSVTILSAPSPVTVEAAIYIPAAYNGPVNFINPSTEPFAFPSQIQSRNTTVSSGSAVVSPGATQIISLKIPDLLYPNGYNYRLLIKGQDQSGANFSESTYISRKNEAERSNTLLLIQTNKPLYKVGDTVQFRVIAVDRNLRPANTPIDVKIYDPQRNLIKQMLNFQSPTDRGFGAGEFEIASQASLGMWSVDASGGNTTTSKTFTVEEYVLPRFDVDFRVPAFVSTSAKSFTATIMANYTFGENVTGRATISVKGPSNFVSDPLCASKPMPMVPAMSPAQFPQLPSADGSMSSPGFPGVSAIYPPNGCSPVDRAPWKNFTIDNFNGKATVTVLLSDILDSMNGYEILTIHGSVTEANTNLVRNATTSVSLRSQLYRLDMHASSPSFRPGTPVTIVIKAIMDDGRPIPPTTKKLKVKINIYGSVLSSAPGFTVNDEKSFDVPASGTVSFDVVPPTGTKSLYISAQLGKVTGGLNVEGASSPSNSFINIVPLTTNTTLGQPILFSVELTNYTDVSRLNYTIFSKGRTFTESSVSVNGPKTSLQVPLTAEIAPRGRLLVYYIRPDKEVVANVMDFTVSDFMRNPVNMSIEPATGASYTQPGESVRVRVTTSPNSLVGMLGMDQSLLLLSSGNDLTSSTVENWLDSMDDNRWTFSTQYGNTSDFWIPYSQSVWSYFQNAGLLVLSNAVIPGSPNEMQYGGGPSGPLYSYAASAMGGGASGGYAGAAESDIARPVAAPAPMPPGNSNGPQQMPGKSPTVRKDFRETFLYETALSGPSGIVNFTRAVPDTITSWVCTAFSLNNELGLGLTKKAATLKVFQPFFVVLNLPYSIVRGETLQTEILIFNYLNQDQDVQVTFTAQGQDWRGTAFSPPPQQQRITVRSNNFTRVVFPITPAIVGDVNIKVQAQSSVAGDAVEKSLLVKAEGVQQQFTAPVFIDLRNRNSMSAVVPITVPNSGIVSGSEKMVIKAIGDVLGPTISGIDNLIRLPQGCGEQNLLSLAPNIYVLKYLQAGNRLDDRTRTRLLRNMNIGYQRELTYRHSDGSFSAFGARDPSGSTFLTAMVLKIFAQASRNMSVDSNILEQASVWLVRQQARNGSFPEVGKIIDRELQGGVGGPVSLTAYVLIAMIEAQPMIRTDLRGNMQRAYSYLESQIRRPLDVYELAIVTYALQLSGSGLANQVRQRFLTAAVDRNGTRHWSKEPETVTNQMGKYSWEYQLPAKDIEITAYGLLQYVRNKDATGGYPVLAWLLSKRNEQGGFQSSQDTVVGLQALASFAELMQDSSKNVNVTVTAREFSKTFMISNENAVVLQAYEPKSVNDRISVAATGTGTALAQITWLYNVRVVPEKPMFDVKVNADAVNNNLQLTICARYLGNEVSNMVVMEINLPSGYQFEEEQANSLANDINSELSHVEVENESTQLRLYFDQLSTANQQCTRAPAFKLYNVNGNLEGNVVVYDYYKPINRKTVMYSVFAAQK
ncbi:CD109 antigen-like [Paramacrobiotus metropolitanus]|uniref:CD109 antigen-like n=1 Tax=Paramacrobiotus metropolitanus TaxID=2943436 RepID=UPI0024463DC2|nr:CD109 antigen-like [Paramacrobiotus metropolitanus]